MTLQEISLRFLSNNLHTYLLSDNETIKEILGILRYHFSTYILDYLTNKGQYVLERKFYDFLIHKNLKELNTSIFHQRDWKCAREALTRIGEGLEKVTFVNNFTYRHAEICYLEDFVHILLKHMPNLKHLIMDSCNDETLKIVFAFCKKLENLSFGCVVTDGGLKCLCPNNKEGKLNIRFLSLEDSNSHCDDGIMHLLQNMNSLEMINYSNLDYVLHNMHVEDLANKLDEVQKYNLTSLNVFDDTATTLLPIASELCPKLMRVMIYASETKQLEILAKLPNLVHVNIDGVADYVLGLNEFFRLAGNKLKVLKLSNNLKISVPLMVKSCPRLEHLSLSYIEYAFVSEEEHHLPPLRELVELKIIYVDHDNNNTQKALSLLFKSCFNIKKLFISSYPDYLLGQMFEETLPFEESSSVVGPNPKRVRTEIPNNEVRAKFPNLVHINFSMRGSETVDVETFLNATTAKKLKVLELWNFKLSVPALIESCQRIESLSLSRIKYTPIMECYLPCTPLRALVKLCVSDIRPPGLRNAERCLSLLLSCCCNLEELVLESMSFGETRLPEICNGAANIKTLSLIYCTFPALRKAYLLEHIVVSCRSLKKLVLEKCINIRPIDIKKLWALLKSNDESNLIINFTNYHSLDIMHSDSD